MSKEEVWKFKTCTFKVNIHCNGCKHKVEKTLKKIEGVYKVDIDGEDNGKVTVTSSLNVDPSRMIKKLKKTGKPARIWDAPEQNLHMSDPFKKMQIDDSKDIGGGSGKSKARESGGGCGEAKSIVPEIVADDEDDDDDEFYDAMESHPLIMI